MCKTVDAKHQDFKTSKNQIHLKHNKKVNSRRVIFGDYWCDSQHSSVTHKHQHSVINRQFSNGESHHHHYYESDPNFMDKRNILNYSARRRIREVHSFPSIGKNPVKLKSSLVSMRDRQRSLPLSVSFNPKVSIHLIDFSEETFESKQSPSAGGYWSQYLPFISQA